MKHMKVVHRVTKEKVVDFLLVCCLIKKNQDSIEKLTCPNSDITKVKVIAKETFFKSDILSNKRNCFNDPA